MMRSPTKAARLIALHEAIEAEAFDPDTVNMSDLARALNVNRATILRDLAMVDEVQDEIGKMRSAIAAVPLTETGHLRKTRQ